MYGDALGRKGSKQGVLVLWWWTGGREVGLGVGVGVVGPAGMVDEEKIEEGCALIGLGAEIWDIHRGFAHVCNG